jgi:hypothetical protein
MFAVKNAAGLPQMAERLKSEDVADEIFGTLGYKDATRFFRNDQEQEQYSKENPQQPPMEMQIKMKEQEMHEKDNAARDRREIMKLEMTAQLGFAKLLLDRGMSHDEVMLKLGIEKMHDKTTRTRQTKALDNVVQLKEHTLRRETGAGV